MKYKINDEESIYCEKIEYKDIFEKIRDNNFIEIKKLKNDQRSIVTLIEIEGKKFVLKKPVEKLKSKFQRILTTIFKGESKREFDGCKKILESSFKGAEPIIVWEKKEKNEIVDSYFLMAYIEPKICVENEIQKIRDELYKIHKSGFYHGDASKFNFIIVENDEVYLIDTKLKKDYFGLGRVGDFIELQKNTSFREFDLQNRWYYKVLWELDILKEKLNYLRKNIRRKFL